MKEITLSISGNKESQSKKLAVALQKKIEKVALLKSKQEILLSKINSYKELYNIDIKDTETTLYKTTEDYIEKLLSKFKQKSFSQKHLYMIEELIDSDIEFLYKNNYHSERFQVLIEDFKQIKEERLSDQDKTMINSIMKNVVEDMGYHTGDDDNFDFDSFINDMEQQEDQKAEDHYKNYQDNQKAKKVITTDKDFAKIYKTLAKKIHPDLVTDSQEKNTREQWMKRLSEIWSQRNYMELLKFKNEIEGTDIYSYELAKSQYKNLISQLNEEIQNLESQEYIIKHHDPETAFYYQNFHARSQNAVNKKIQNYLVDIKAEIDKTQEEISHFKTQTSTRSFLNEKFQRVNYFDIDF